MKSDILYICLDVSILIGKKSGTNYTDYRDKHIAFAWL